MIKDPKQIVTPFAFEVHPSLLGLPLATPKRRLFALLLDLLIASILTALGAFFLAITASILFFWLAIRNRGKIWWKNFLRYSAAAFISLLVFALTWNSTKDKEAGLVQIYIPTDQEKEVPFNTDEVDWGALAQQFSALGNNDSVDYEDKLELIAKNIEATMTRELSTSHEYSSKMFEEAFLIDLENFRLALSKNDSTTIDSIRSKIVPILASTELQTKSDRIVNLRDEVKALDERNEELEDQVENPSFLRTLRATGEDFGLSLGWIGIYFVLCLALFKGQTLGKRMLSLQVVRLNNKPIGLLYSFERFGGYAAGIATGLLGFAQVYWDANRQGIHDKIAGTVVLDKRKKRIEKYKELRNEILDDENLLS